VKGGSRAPTPLALALAGARSAPPFERAGFGALLSFAATIPISRTVNYVRERDRNAPALRSLARRVASAPQSGDIRVHHFVPGVGIAFAAGAAAILTQERRAFRLSVPFGVGAGLALDELEVMVGRDNPYWGSQGFALVQSAAAAAGAAALGLGFTRRDNQRSPES